MWTCKSLFKRRHSSVIKVLLRWKWWMFETMVKLSTFKIFRDTLCLPQWSRLLQWSFWKLKQFGHRIHLVFLDDLKIIVNFCFEQEIHVILKVIAVYGFHVLSTKTPGHQLASKCAHALMRWRRHVTYSSLQGQEFAGGYLFPCTKERLEFAHKGLVSSLRKGLKVWSHPVIGLGLIKTAKGRHSIWKVFELSPLRLKTQQSVSALEWITKEHLPNPSPSKWQSLLISILFLNKRKQKYWWS